MKSIDTLIPDIYATLDNPKAFDEEHVQEFGKSLAKTLAARLAEQREGDKLRLSNWSSACARQLHLKINSPHVVEKLPPDARLKFIIGDIFEALLLYLAKQAGHTVEGEQEELVLNGVVGHRDAIIDGRTVDVKSASPYSFKKFEDGQLAEKGNDPFGYVGQVTSYKTAGLDDPRMTDKENASFLVGNKVTGKLALDTHKITKTKAEVEAEIDERRKMLQGPLPPRHYQPEPMGAKGNMKLPVACSYCPVKQACYPKLRAFAYATGPVFLTTVADLPRVPEISIDHAVE